MVFNLVKVLIYLKTVIGGIKNSKIFIKKYINSPKIIEKSQTFHQLNCCITTNSQITEQTINK